MPQESPASQKLMEYVERRADPWVPSSRFPSTLTFLTSGTSAREWSARSAMRESEKALLPRGASN
jgi:hypothetical protein